MEGKSGKKTNGAMTKALLAVFMWGTMSTSTKLLMNQMDAMFALSFSCLFATAVLLLVAAFRGKLPTLRHLSGKDAGKMILIGSLGVFFYNACYLIGTKTLPAQTAFIINDLWPALIIVFSGLLLGEKITFGKAAAVLLSFLGIIVVVTNGDFKNFRLADLKGVVCCLGAAITYSLYSVLNKKAAYDKELGVLLSYASGTVAAFLCSALLKTMRVPSLRELAGIAYNGVFCNALPYFLWALAMENGRTAVIANLGYLAPVVSLFVTHFVLGEEITLFSVLGVGLILLGIAIQILADRKNT